MLNRKLIAAAVAFGLVGSAQAVTVYDNNDTSLAIGGRAAANYNSVNAAKDTSDGKSKLEGTARLSIDAKTKIYEGVRAIGFAEWEVASESGENGKFDTRYAYVGFDTDSFGKLIFGQSETAIYNALGVTDVYVDYGFAGNTYGELGSRQEGQAIYKIEVAGFDFGASYQTSSLKNVDNGYALSAGYTLGEEFPLHIGVGMDHYNLSDDIGRFTKNDSPTSFGVGLSAGKMDDGFYVAGLYQHTSVDTQSDFNGYEFVAGYGFENGLVGYVSYENLRQGSNTRVSNIVAEVKYNFNEYFRVYTDASFGMGDVDNEDGSSKRADDLFTVGLQFNF